MESSHSICPWCDTEIVWDPEVGPEDECPHCFNELGEYRSIKLAERDENEHEDEGIHDDDDEEWIEEETEPDFVLDDDYAEDLVGAVEDEFLYEQSIKSCLDEQEELSECHVCREPMLRIGEQKLDGTYEPVIPQSLGIALLPHAPRFQIFVCPSCFRMEYSLSGEERIVMINALQRKASEG